MFKEEEKAQNDPERLFEVVQEGFIDKLTKEYERLRCMALDVKKVAEISGIGMGNRNFR